MNEVLFYILFSIPFGLTLYLTLVRHIKAHVIDNRDHARFFLYPYPPRRMLILHKLDGKFSIYYDDQIKEIKGDEKSEVSCKNHDEVDHFVLDGNLSDYSLKVSMYDARGAKGYDSPFSLAWRWIVAASFTVYINYIAMIEGWFPRNGEPDMFWAMLGTMAFFLSLMWFLTNIIRFRDETIEYIYLLPKSINQGLTEYVHAPEPLSNLSLPNFLKRLGKEIKVEVPNELKEVFENLKKGKKDVLVSALSLTKFYEAEAWRKALSQSLEDMMKLRKAGETIALIKMKGLIYRPVMVYVVIFILGLIIGYIFGNIFSIGFEEPTEHARNLTQVPIISQIPQNITLPQPQLPELPEAPLKPAPPPPPPTR